MGELLFVAFMMVRLVQQEPLFSSAPPVAAVRGAAAEAKPVFTLSAFTPRRTPTLDPRLLEQLSATNMLVRELGGAVLLNQRGSEVRPIASLTKLMTALEAVERYAVETKFTISKNAIATEGASGDFTIGETFDRDQLIKAALVASSNDATEALAERAGLEAFIQAMNARASSLGLRSTRYVEPAGISSENVGSLDDLSTLIDYLWRNQPDLLQWSTLETTTLRGVRTRRLLNLNYLLSTHRDIIVGSKTGSTPAAGECLVLLVRLPNSPPIFVGLLNSTNRFDDAKKILTALTEAYD